MKWRIVSYVGGGALLLILLFVSDSRARRARDFGKLEGGYYMGSADGVEFSVALSNDPEDCDAWLAETGRGDSRWLRTDNSGVHYGNAHRSKDGSLVFGNGDGNLTKWKLRVMPAADNENRVAEFSLRDESSAPRTLQLRQVAERCWMKRSSGLRVGNYGARAEHQSCFPVFNRTSAFFRQIDTELRAWNRQHAKEFSVTTLSDVWNGVRAPSCGNVQQCSVAWFPTYCSEQLLSLFALHWEYGGGAHPNSWFETVTYTRNGEHAVKARLADFFAPDTDWQQRLSAFCLAELRKLGASSVVDGGIQQLDADKFVFAVDSRGFRIFFAPYEVGCYAEGAYMVHVPFDALRSCLRTGDLAAQSAK